MGHRVFCKKYLPGARAFNNVRIWAAIDHILPNDSGDQHYSIFFSPITACRLGDRQYFFPKRSKRDNVTGLFSTTIIGLIKSTDVDNEADIDCVLKIPGTDYARSARNGANDSTNNGTCDCEL